MVYVVERYLPGLSRSDLLGGLSRLEQAAAGAGEVRYLGSTIVLEDEACFCEFEGPSEAAVAEANRLAGLAYDRITPAVTVTPTERSIEMNVSTPAMPGTIRISRSRLAGLVLAAAAVAAAITGVVVAFTTGGGSTATPRSALSAEVQAYVNNVPLIPAIPGAVVLSSPTAGKVLPPLTASPGAMFGPITTGKVLPPQTAPPGAMFGQITTGR
jgi:Protein of unknown function (DUF4242)